MKNKRYRKMLARTAALFAAAALGLSGCTVSPPSVKEDNGVLFYGSGEPGDSGDNVKAVYTGDCRFYRADIDTDKDKASLTECGEADVTEGELLLLYGTQSGKEIAVSDVVIIKGQSAGED